MTTPAVDTTSQQYIRDMNLGVEYKYLQNNAPSGVYIIPELDNIRHMHGVVFVRRGMYRNGIFRFELVLPANYNSRDSYPSVRFMPPILHPLVHPSTGVLDLAAAYPIWNPDSHFLASVLVFVKKIFYEKSFREYVLIANHDANKMLEDDAQQYEELVQQDVQKSLNRLYDSPPSPNCPLVFTEPKPAHIRLKEKILKKFEAENSSASSTATSPLSKSGGGGGGGGGISADEGSALQQISSSSSNGSSSIGSSESNIPLNHTILVKGERIIFAEKTDS